MRDEPRWRRYLRFWGQDPERDIDDELGFHMAMRVAEYEHEGYSPDEARSLATERFGDVGDVREECRELSVRRAGRRQRASWRDAIGQDLRYAVRTLAASRGFSLAIITTVALAIGAGSAVFSVAYGVLLRPLVYPDAGALVRLWTRVAERQLDFFSVSPADYKVWREARSFAAMGAFERQREVVLTRPDGPEPVELAPVMPEVFELLGTRPALGRPIVESDASADAAPVVVLSHGEWSRYFGADSGVVGRRILIDDRPHTVVGVMPRHFAVPGTPAGFWTPLSLATASTDHSARYLRVLGRLAPGVTLERARAELDVIARRLAEEFPATNARWTINSLSIPELIIGQQFRRSVIVLLGVVGIVLLIACANSANLHLARAAAREREISVRAALGASRGRVAGQLLIESVLLAIVAGGLGLVLAFWGIELLRVLGATAVPRLDEVRLDLPVILFTVLMTIATGLVFGLAPALRASRTDLATALRHATRSATGGRRGSDRVRSALVVGEVMLSLILLVGAGLLMRSFVRLQGVELGFDPTGLEVAAVRLPPDRYPDRERLPGFYDGLLERVAAIPGVTGASLVSSAPFGGPNSGNIFVRTDRALPEQGYAPDTDYRVITPGYLRLLRIPIVRGRDLAPTDVAGGERVVLVSETVVRQYWPDDDPLGDRVRFGDIVSGPEFTIVGIVGDARYQSLETPETRPMMYFASPQRPENGMTIVVRSTDAAATGTGIRAAVAAMDPKLAPSPPRRLDDLVATALATRRFALVLFVVFAASATVLAAVGVYGVMAYLVRQRTRELGIRIALGASPRRLMASVVWRALQLTLAGVVLGTFAAIPLTRALDTLLFETNATDRTTFVLVGALIVAVGALAGFIPARRATRTDPLEVLRAEG
jgi:predicted permease